MPAITSFMTSSSSTILTFYQHGNNLKLFQLYVFYYGSSNITSMTSCNIWQYIKVLYSSEPSEPITKLLQFLFTASSQILLGNRLKYDWKYDWLLSETSLDSDSNLLIGHQYDVMNHHWLKLVQSLPEFNECNFAVINLLWIIKQTLKLSDF